MARTASTTEITEQIFQGLKSSNFPAQVKLEYFKGTTYTDIELVDEARGINWGKSAKRYDYANHSLTPLSSKIDFSVFNLKGKFSEGSGDAEADVFSLDRKVRLKAGYVLKNKNEIINQTLNLNDSNAVFFFTKFNVSFVDLDEANAAGLTVATNIYFDDFFNPAYDTETYDDSTYTPVGYYLTTFDFGGKDFAKVVKFDINCNHTDGTVYFRFINSLSTVAKANSISTTFINAGATVNGTKTVSPTVTGRFIQIAVVIDGVAFSDDIRLNSIVIQYNNLIEFIYTDIFYLDTPEETEPPDPLIPKINISGRDVYKRAIENEINLADLSGGVALDQLIKDICDIIKIQFSATSIVDLSSFGNRTLATGLDDVEKADKIFEKIMQIINKSGSVKYQMFLEYDSTLDENIMFVQPRPSTFLATFVQSFKKFRSIASKRKNYDKLLKRITVLNKNQTLDEEELLDNDTGITTAGDFTSSWVGNAIAKRFEVTLNSGTKPTITIKDVLPTSMVFTITGIPAFDLRIKVFGNKWRSGVEPDSQGEFINFDNMDTSKGNTKRITNLLILTDTEAHDIAKGIIEDFGDPVIEAKGLVYPYLNLLPEINDMNMLWTRWVFLDDLFFITGITHRWNRAKVPQQTTTFNLDDSGLNFFTEGAIVYDRDKAPVNGTVVGYDKGFLYDMKGGPQQTQAQAEAAHVPIRNLGLV